MIRTVYLLIYALKNCNQDLYGFNELISSWGYGRKFQNYCRFVTLNVFDLKVRFLIPPPLGRAFFANNTNLLALTIMTSNLYSVPSGSRTDLHARLERPSLLMGYMDGMDGMGWME